MYIDHMCWYCYDEWWITLHEVVICSSCTFLNISISTCPEVAHLTILTHTHNKKHQHILKLIEDHYSKTQRTMTMLHWRSPSLMDLHVSNNSTQTEPHNMANPSIVSNPISEAMNPRESTWHTCCCSAFPVRPWKSTSQSLESSSGILPVSNSSEENRTAHSWLAASWKAMNFWRRKITKQAALLFLFLLWTNTCSWPFIWEFF